MVPFCLAVMLLTISPKQAFYYSAFCASPKPHCRHAPKPHPTHRCGRHCHIFLLVSLTYSYILTYASCYGLGVPRRYGHQYCSEHCRFTWASCFSQSITASGCVFSFRVKEFLEHSPLYIKDNPYNPKANFLYNPQIYLQSFRDTSNGRHSYFNSK